MLVSALEARGYTVTPYDLVLDTDILDTAPLAAAADGCEGIIHLAAVARVHLGEADPRACWRTNVEGTASVLAAAERCPLPPWVLLVSSREVYGQARVLPVREDAPVAPVNTYARSKVAAERLLEAVSLDTVSVRLTNVYGSARDHADRFIPAMCARALEGSPMEIHGPERVFDFIHVDDAVAGLVSAAEALGRGEHLPPVHLVSGTPHTLRQIAQLVRSLTGSSSQLIAGPDPQGEVSQFCGDPTRAFELLGWRAFIPLREGLEQLLATRPHFHTQSALEEVACAS